MAQENKGDTEEKVANTKILFPCMHTLQLKIDIFQGMDYEFIPSLTNANSEDIEKYFSQAQYKLRNMVKQCLFN